MTMREKVAHVLGSKQLRPHTCHWPGCNKQVPPAMWGCLKHWRRLPARLRSAIWLSYRVGQEIDMKPSAEYLAVVREVQDWIERQYHA